VKTLLTLAITFSACATTPAGIRREAIARMEDCVKAAQQPELARGPCTDDVQGYCAAHHISCDSEWLWQAVQTNLPDE